MVEELDELYREVILDHFKNSSHAGRIPGAEVTATGNNPLCGDDLTFDLQLADGRIRQARFAGKGCAISQAAASMLAGQLEGRTPTQAQQLIAALKAMMRGAEPDAAVDLGDLEALAGVRKFPVRVKCAALSWNVVEQGLTTYAQKSDVRNQRSE